MGKIYEKINFFIFKNISVKEMFDDGESVEYGGKLIAHMAQNPKIMKFSSKIVIGSDYGQKYGIRDVDNRVIPSQREFKNMAPFILPKNLRFLAKYVPSSIKVPYSFIDIANSKYYK